MNSQNLVNRIASYAINIGHTVGSVIGKDSHFERTFRVERPPQEVYAFWRDFHNFKKATRAADVIEVRNPKHSRWVVRGPFGISLKWSSEITAEVLDQRVSWRTTAPSDVPHVGRVEFTSIDNGKATEVAIAIDYRMPLGFIGTAIAWVTGAGPSTFISEEISRVKLAIEEHRSHAASVAESKHLLDLAEGPPNPPVHASPKKGGKNARQAVNNAKAPTFDARQRLRTQH